MSTYDVEVPTNKLQQARAMIRESGAHIVLSAPVGLDSYLLTVKEA